MNQSHTEGEKKKGGKIKAEITKRICQAGRNKQVAITKKENPCYHGTRPIDPGGTSREGKGTSQPPPRPAQAPELTHKCGKCAIRNSRSTLGGNRLAQRCARWWPRERGKMWWFILAGARVWRAMGDGKEVFQDGGWKQEQEEGTVVRTRCFDVGIYTFTFSRLTSANTILGQLSVSEFFPLISLLMNWFCMNWTENIQRFSENNMNIQEITAFVDPFLVAQSAVAKKKFSDLRR